MIAAAQTPMTMDFVNTHEERAVKLHDGARHDGDGDQQNDQRMPKLDLGEILLLFAHSLFTNLSF